MNAETTAAVAREPWIQLPSLDQASAEAWAANVVETLSVTDRLADLLSAEDPVQTLSQFAQQDPLTGFPLRFVFTPSLGLGSVLVSVSAVPVLADDVVRAQRKLLTLDDLGEFTGYVDDLREVGVEGYQLLRLDRQEVAALATESPAKQEVVGSLLTVVRRDLAGLGPVDTVSVARSTNLALIFASVLPTIELLLGDEVLSLGGDHTHM